MANENSDIPTLKNCTKVQRKTWREVYQYTKMEDDQDIEGKIQYCSVLIKVKF